MQSGMDQRHPAVIIEAIGSKVTVMIDLLYEDDRGGFCHHLVREEEEEEYEEGKQQGDGYQQDRGDDGGHTPGAVRWMMHYRRLGEKR
jgi:hypothetical protein